MPDSLAPGPAWDTGRPGASARAEYQRRIGRDRANRDARFGRLLGPVVGALNGPSPATVNWERGGAGEERVGRYLTRAVGSRGVILHDRAEGRHANIDHIALVPSGIWVIDTKRYVGRVQPRGGWFGASRSLFVNGRNRNNLIAGALRQRQLVQNAVGTRAIVRVALCFTDGEWGFLAKPFVVRDVLVTWPRRLATGLLGAGALEPCELDALAVQLNGAFPAYAPSGTSHRPTGAWPRG